MRKKKTCSFSLSIESIDELTRLTSKLNESFVLNLSKTTVLEILILNADKIPTSELIKRKN